MTYLMYYNDHTPIAICYDKKPNKLVLLILK